MRSWSSGWEPWSSAIGNATNIATAIRNVGGSSAGTGNATSIAAAIRNVTSQTGGIDERPRAARLVSALGAFSAPVVWCNLVSSNLRAADPSTLADCLSRVAIVLE
jgi:hypothetical protein